jgi:hypothetical protein
MSTTIRQQDETQVPVRITFQFGKNLPKSVNPSDVLTLELKDQITKLLTGKFEVDEQGRAIISPLGDPGPFVPDGAAPRDSICVSVSLGPVEVSYCMDL